jgi:hypothetical protein
MGTICWKCGMEVPTGAPACPACGAAVAGTGGQSAQPFAAAAPQPFAMPPSPAATPSQGYMPPPPPPNPGFQPAPTPQAFQPSAPPAPPSFSPMQSSPQPGFAPVQQGYAPAPPMMPPGPPPMAQAGGGGGSAAVKIILIIVAVIIGIGILGAAVVGYGIWRVAHAVHQAAHGGTVTIPGAQGGSFSINTEKTYSAAELGIDIYPGAASLKGGMKIEVPNASTITGIFSTSDSKDQVIAFYKEKMGSDITTMDFGDSAMLTLKRGNNDQVTVAVSNRANENDGKTKIVITHTHTKSP